jgi:transposase-like protein
MDTLLSSFNLAKTNDKTAYEILKQLNIINSNNPTCPSCFARTNIEKGKTRHGFNGSFRCTNRACRKRYSLLWGSVFEHSRLSFMQIAGLMLSYFSKDTQRDIALEVKVSLQTVNDIFKLFRTKIGNFQNIGMLDGEVYEVDETHLFSRKNDQGRILAGQKYWDLGIFSHETKHIRLKTSRLRNSMVLTNFITANVNQGKCIISDFWRGYNNIGSIYTHKKVNHKLNFVDPHDNSIHTNNIERVWRELKKNLKNISKLETLELYIREFMILYNNRVKTKEEKIKILVDAIRLNN